VLTHVKQIVFVIITMSFSQRVVGAAEHFRQWSFIEPCFPWHELAHWWWGLSIHWYHSSTSAWVTLSSVFPPLCPAGLSQQGRWFVGKIFATPSPILQTSQDFFPTKNSWPSCGCQWPSYSGRCNFQYCYWVLDFHILIKWETTSSRLIISAQLHLCFSFMCNWSSLVWMLAKMASWHFCCNQQLISNSYENMTLTLVTAEWTQDTNPASCWWQIGLM
jgi:hypothetical protein